MVIALYRTRPLRLSENKWLTTICDSKLGLVFGTQVVPVSNVVDALRHKVVICLGAQSRANLLSVSTASDAGCRGVEEWAGSVVVTTWDITVMGDEDRTLELLGDFLVARMFAFGLGNPSCGYVEEVVLGGGGQECSYSVARYEQVVGDYMTAMRLRA